MLGVLGVYKPSGISSFDVIRVIKQRTGIKKLGHGGTLDPLAEGVLPILVGEASVFFDAVLASPKTYEALIRLGSFTETDDAEGAVTKQFPLRPVTLEEVQSFAKGATGEILQAPPKYSALKVGGRRAYELAREGVEMDLKPRKVFVYGWQGLEVEGSLIKASVTCSSGTYIRSLARSLGEALEIGAHLEGLKRTRCGGLGVEDCIGIKEIQTDWQDYLAPLERALDYMPKLVWKGSLSWLKDGKPLSEGPYDCIEGAYGGDLYLLVFDAKILGLVRRAGNKVFYQRNLSRLYDQL